MVREMLYIYMSVEPQPHFEWLPNSREVDYPPQKLFNRFGISWPIIFVSFLNFGRSVIFLLPDATFPRILKMADTWSRLGRITTMSSASSVTKTTRLLLLCPNVWMTDGQKWRHVLVSASKTLIWISLKFQLIEFYTRGVQFLHLTVESRSFCRIMELVWLLITPKSLISSVKMTNFECLMVLPMLLINKRKRRGPCFDPWGIRSWFCICEKDGAV